MGSANYLNNCRSGLTGACTKCYEKTANEIGRISRSSSVRSREGAFEAEESTYIMVWRLVRPCKVCRITPSNRVCSGEEERKHPLLPPPPPPERKKE